MAEISIELVLTEDQAEHVRAMAWGLLTGCALDTPKCWKGSTNI